MSETASSFDDQGSRPGRARGDLSRYALIEPPPRHEDAQGSWLMSYLDLLTLLITLFVLLLSLQGLHRDDTAAPSPASDNAVTAEMATARPSTLPALTADSPLWQWLAPGDFSTSVPFAPAASGPTVTPVAEAVSLALTHRWPLSLTDDAMPLLMTVAALHLPSALPASTANDSDMARWAAQVPDIDGVVVEPGERHVTFRIQDRLLFSSADVELSDQGRGLLDRLAERLQQFDGEISVEGHTDSRSISTERFPSNWELSAARATAVLHYLVDHGVSAAQLRAIGYGATRPLADNDTARGRARNRRVELVLRPAASDLARSASRAAGE